MPHDSTEAESPKQPKPPDLEKVRKLERPVSRRGPNACTAFRVPLRVVTPILGGGVSPRDVDHVDYIRVPAVRGMLRMWWRSLWQGAEGKSLADAERELWGGVHGGDAVRSQVDISIRVTAKPGIDSSFIDSSFIGTDTKGAYALWPARGTQREPTAPRMEPGVEFELSVSCPDTKVLELERCIRAWILFGGYGGRTRRGLGGLGLSASASDGDRRRWLPKISTPSGVKGGLVDLLGIDITDATAAQPTDTPMLPGCTLVVSKLKREAVEAWVIALDALREFRQGVSSGAREAPARGSVGMAARPGPSSWPEPDKVRHCAGTGPWEHAPRHNATPVWPRAGFGLPINGRFQTLSRQKDPSQPKRYLRFSKPEPDAYELLWQTADDVMRNRLASPLIVKAMPVRDGDGDCSFMPIALWLNRAYPEDGKVGLRWPKNTRPKEGKSDLLSGSLADFDALVAPGDTAYFKPLETEDGQLRTAFTEWLGEQKEWVCV